MELLGTRRESKENPRHPRKSPGQIFTSENHQPWEIRGLAGNPRPFEKLWESEQIPWTSRELSGTSREMVEQFAGVLESPGKMEDGRRKCRTLGNPKVRHSGNTLSFSVVRHLSRHENFARSGGARIAAEVLGGAIWRNFLFFFSSLSLQNDVPNWYIVLEATQTIFRPPSRFSAHQIDFPPTKLIFRPQNLFSAHICYFPPAEMPDLTFCLERPVRPLGVIHPPKGVSGFYTILVRSFRCFDHVFELDRVRIKTRPDTPHFLKQPRRSRAPRGQRPRTRREARGRGQPRSPASPARPALAVLQPAPPPRRPQHNPRIRTPGIADLGQAAILHARSFPNALQSMVGSPDQ